MDPEGVSKAFVEHYYSTFDTNRSALSNLYQEPSMLTFEGQKAHKTLLTNSLHFLSSNAKQLLTVSLLVLLLLLVCLFLLVVIFNSLVNNTLLNSVRCFI